MTGTEDDLADNLEQDSKYEVKVEARNEWGWSGTSQVFRFFTRNKGELGGGEVITICQHSFK